ncbi:uncharacterized protein LOC107768953 isoform X1 [Nicotiana tabacum]|uniref:Uncharacterized protein LOC107768953 isoform X1 n=1 Tax=Nicotiana tabacum TaxID=4097 RepID=A0A1S3XUS0_TOBAC|nr:PREDICTED: uncharacterized protein LOC107768953 isoform X1 [Nicotiana tabacum]
MVRSKLSSKISHFLRNPLFSTPLRHHHHRFPTILQPKQSLHNLCNVLQNGVPFNKHISVSALRYLSTNSLEEITPDRNGNDSLHYETIEDVEPIDLWEEEDEDAKPEIGDGGDGGGIVLQSCPWGEQALSLAHDVLLQFGDEMKLYAFKTSPRGYIYVRIDKLPNESTGTVAACTTPKLVAPSTISVVVRIEEVKTRKRKKEENQMAEMSINVTEAAFNRYGCPSMDEMEEFSRQYKKMLDEAGALGKIPDDLALEVSSPGAERLLKVPDDLSRFKDMPMRVSYIEEMNSRNLEKDGIFFLESVDAELGSCMWKLADVKENRDPAAKGRPLSRKQKDWRLRLPYAMVKRVTLYLDY